MLTLYYVPGACSLCPHIALREAGLSFRLERVNPKTKQTESGTDYLSINPKGYVPTLEMNNGQLLTEVTAISQYIADLAPAKKLAPLPGTVDRLRLQEWLNFIATELHKGFSPLYNPKIPDVIKGIFRDQLASRIAYVADALEGKDYLMGNKAFTVADAYLYTVLRWSTRMNIDLPPILQEYRERISTRPAVKAALENEGLSEQQVFA